MSSNKIKIIEDRIRTNISPAKFQTLCAAYLVRSRPELKHTAALYGEVKGAEKTKKGLPDTYFVLSNGQYVFVGCSTEQNKVFQKLKKDLLDCFNAGIESKDINTVILCYTGETISPVEDKELRDLAKSNGIILELIGINQLAFALQKEYPPLAKEYLDISIDTGQIIDDFAFCQEHEINQFGTGIDQALIGREDLFQKIISQIKEKKVTVLSGKPGVGKTRLGLELCRKWCEFQEEYQFRVISSKVKPLGDDLHYHFGKKEKWILLVDDANRLADIENLLYFFKDNSTAKILFTVRDSQIKKIKNVFNGISFRLHENDVIDIPPLTDDDIKALLDSIQVRNWNCVHKIQGLVKGNPRLALMAGNVARSKNSCDALNDIHSVYVEYFHSHIEGMSDLQLKILAILSVFRTLRREDNEFYGLIFSAFGYDRNEIWTGFIELDEQFETVDFDDSDVPEYAKIADQILASYVFYQVFIERRLLSFSKLLFYFLEKHKGRIRDTLSPILSSYGHEKIVAQLSPLVSEARRSFEHEKSDLLWLFYEEFAYCQSKEAILFLHQQLAQTVSETQEETQALIKNNIHWPKSSLFIGILKHLKHDIGQSQLGISLMIEYLHKKLSLLDEAVKYCEESLYFHSDDLENGYVLQVNLLNSLLNSIETNDYKLSTCRLLLDRIVGKYLAIIALNINVRALVKDSSTINTPIGTVESLIQVRKRLWLYVFSQKKTQPVWFEAVWEQAQNVGYISKIKSNLLTEEAPFVIDLIIKHFVPDSLKDGLMAHSYLDFVQKSSTRRVRFIACRKRFITQTYRHFQLLYANHYRQSKRRRTLTRRDYNSYSQIQIGLRFSNYQLGNYVILFESYNKIIELNKADGMFSVHFNHALTQLFDKSRGLFLDLMIHLWQTGNSSGFKCPVPVEKLLIIFEHKEEQLWELMSSYDFQNKPFWQFYYLIHLPEHCVTETQYDRLLKCIYRVPWFNFWQWNYLTKYKTITSNVIVEVLKILLERVHTQKSFHFTTYDIIEKYGSDFPPNCASLLKELYFYLVHKEIYDVDGQDFQVLYQLDKSFLWDYIKKYYPNDVYAEERYNEVINDLSFLWEEEDYFSTIRQLIHYFSRTKYFSYHPSKFIQTLFYPRSQKVPREKAISTLKEILHLGTGDAKLIHYIFEIVVNGFQNHLLEFMELFIKQNDSFEIFVKLPVRPSSMMFPAGMHGAILQNQMESWKKIENLLPPGNLNFMKHRAYINENINRIEKEIELANKEKFWRDY